MLLERLPRLFPIVAASFAVLPAQGGWVDVTPAVAPGPQLGPGAAMCYDPVRAVTWLVQADQFVFSWDGLAWTTTHTPPNPLLGSVFGAVWDPVVERVVVGAAFGNNVATFASWDGVSWAQLPSLSLAGSGINPDQANLAYDEVNGVLFLAVRLNAGAPESQFYVFDGASWVQQYPSVAPPMSGSDPRPSMFFDPTRDRVALVDGPANAPRYWEWNGINWAQRFPIPIHNDLGQVAAAPSRGLSLAQTFSPSMSTPRAFALAGGAYEELFLTNWPAMRRRFHLVYDSGRDRFVLFGGLSLYFNYTFNDTWELELGQSASYTTFGAGCPGSGGTPMLGAQGGHAPQVNTVFTVQTSGLPWTAPTFMFVGFSDAFYGSIPLPANLAILGAPLCNLYISGDLLYAAPNVLGVSIWSLAIPNAPGWTFYNQVVAFDPAANPLGLVLSNAGRAVVGQ